MKRLLIFIVIFTVAAFCMFMFVMQDVLFPATYASIVDQVGRQEIEGYGSEIIYWASSMEEGAQWSGLIYVSSIGFDGYEGPISFFCGNLVDGGVSYITDCFGTPRTCKNGPCPHPGIDFGTNRETGLPIVTPFGGKVIKVGDYGAWGNTVAIENNGYQVLLTHLTGFSVAEGDIIEAGSVVGYSGGAVGAAGSGSSTGPHLHFEIRQCREDSDGVMRCYAVDPMNTLLPGQSVNCNWHDNVTNTERNCQCGN